MTGTSWTQTGQQLYLRVRGLSFEQKTGLAAALLLPLLLCLLVAAATGAFAARRDLRTNSETRLPLLRSSLALENTSLEAAHHAAVYIASNSMEHYSGTRIRIASLKSALVRFIEQPNSSLHKNAVAMQSATDAFEKHLEEERSATERATELAGSVRKTANALSHAMEDLLAVIVEPAGQRLATGFLLKLERFTNITENPPAGNDSGKSTPADAFETLWHEATPLVTATVEIVTASGSKLDDDVLALARSYTEALKELADTRRENAVSAHALEESTYSLVSRSRELTAQIRADIAGATASAQAATRYAAILAIIGAGIIVVYAILVAVFQYRRRQVAACAAITPDDSHVPLGQSNNGDAEPQP